MHRGAAGGGWTAAHISEPRGLPCAAGAFLLGRLLGAARIARCRGPGAARCGREAAAQRWAALEHAPCGFAVRVDRGNPRAAQAATSFRAASSGRISIPPRRRMRSTCSMCPTALDRDAVERTFDKYLADWRGKRSGAVAMDQLHALRDSHHRRAGATWADATRRWSCCASFCRIAGRGLGISGRRSRGGTTRRRPTSAICRTPGSPPSTCSPCAASLPTSARPIDP